MKKYIKPTISVIELQAKENIAANPLDSVTSVGTEGSGDSLHSTTTYNLSLFGVNSF